MSRSFERPAIDATHLLAEIDAFGRVGLAEGEGLLRAVYTEPWRAALGMVQQRMEATGLVTWLDAVGNLFGRLEGTEAGPVVMTGSHIDTVPNAGKYDGTLGILGSIAALADLKSRHGAPRRTIDVFVSADEDGARFATEYWGASAVAGLISPDDAERIHDAAGMSMAEAMRSAGFDPARIPSARRADIGAWVELHIEQGRVLELERKNIGIVTALAGRWAGQVRVTGREDHAGTTPMDLRRDAMNGAVRVINEVIRRAEKMGRPTVGTVGRIEARPGASNVVAREVVFSLDIRDTDGDRLQVFVDDLRRHAATVSAESALEIVFENFVWRDPTPMSDGLVPLVESAAMACGASTLRMPSMASHDARIFGPLWPSAMIFVPSLDGRSHCPEEYTSSEDMALGTRVLAEALYRLAY